MTLPLTDDALRTWLATLPDAPPLGDLREGWPQHWYVEPRLADWREIADPRYEGLEDVDLAVAAMARGELPGHLVDHDAWIDELFKDGGGNVYLILPDVRTVDGHTPVFFFDHDKPYRVTAAARSLPELYAREVVRDTLGRDHPLHEGLDDPLPLDPASLTGFADDLADGWREACGLPPRSTPLERRARLFQDEVHGAALGDIDTLDAFQEAYTQRFILADRVDAEALPDLLRPLRWWDDGGFVDHDAALRNAMARTLALANEEATGGDRYRTQQLLAGAKLLEGLLQTGRVELKPHQSPEQVLTDAFGAAHEALTGERFPWGDLPDDDGARLLDSVPDMKAFHDGWKGIVPDEVLAQGDVLAFRIAKDLTNHLNLMKNTIYNLLRRSGDEHLDALSELVPTLLPADQVLVCHGLDAFPKHPGVLALYDRLLAETPYDYVKDSVGRYRERVATGVKPSGWER